MDISGIKFICEIIGTVAFAVSGSVAALEKHFDIFGVLCCAAVTSLGGGITRDLLLGKFPPAMFTDYIYLIVALSTAIITFITARILNTKFERNVKIIDRVNNVFDAVGLGVFTVVGINAAISRGFANNAFFVIFLGTTTGCGGGVLRDVIIREIPSLFTKRIYAVASLAGGGLYFLLCVTLAVNSTIAAVASIVLIFLLRVLASVFRWDLPKAY